MVLNARRWKQIDGVTASTLGTVHMLVSFDGRRTWRMASGGASRIVASNRAADHGGTDNAWYSRTTGTSWTGPKADMLTAIRDGVMAGSANQAAPASFSSTAIFNQAGWVAGWNATFDLALVLANASSSVDSLTLSYSAYEMFRPVDGASVQVRTDDPEGVTVTRIAAGSSSTLRIHVQY